MGNPVFLWQVSQEFEVGQPEIGISDVVASGWEVVHPRVDLRVVLFDGKLIFL